MPAITAIKILGLAGFASYAFARVAMHARWIGWHRLHVVAVPRARLPFMPRGYTIRSLTAAELAPHDIDVDAAEQARRFAAGLECLGAFRGGDRLVGVVWLGTVGGREADIALDFVAPAGSGWDMGMWIDADHRLGRAFAALWAGVGAWLDDRALGWSISTIADYNVTSMAAHRRLGAVELATVRALRVGGWQWIAGAGRGWQRASADRPLRWLMPDPGATERLAVPPNSR